MKPKKTARLINIRIHPDIDDYIRAKSKEDYKNITAVVNDMLVDSMKRNPLKDAK